MGYERASGLDSYPILFFRTLWKVVKNDIVSLLKELHSGEDRLGRINYSQIVHMPKRINSKEVKDYKPIALLNSSLKNISKVLTNKLPPYMDGCLEDTKQVS